MQAFEKRQPIITQDNLIMVREHPEATDRFTAAMPSKQIATDKRVRRKPASRFQRLWNEAETLARENLELEKDLDAVIDRIKADIFTAERRLGETIRQFVYCQLEFAHRKSLLKWQREELNDWIDENLSELMAIGLLDEPLQEKLAVLRAAEMGIGLDPDSNRSAAEQLDDYFGAENNEFDNEPDSTDQRSRNQRGDQFDDDAPDDLLDDESEEEKLAELLRRMHAEFEELQEQLEMPDQRRQRNPVSDKVFQRLFRQTAAALHPDKEADPTLQLDKHALMSELLKARKDHDLVCILKMHEQYADADSGLNADDEQALEEVLVEYLNHQRERLDEIIQQSPLHQMAYSQFYHKQSATVTRRINAHLKQIDAKRIALMTVMSEVKTLKGFKEILAARHDAQLARRSGF